MNSVLALLLGLAALVVGAEMVVREGSALAARFGISPLVVGMTVVSLGTSLPELAIGITAAQQGNAGLAVGNIVGTNLVNILLILGLSALIRPIAFEARTLRLDLPAMTGAALLLFVLAVDGDLGASDAVIGLTIVAVGTSAPELVTTLVSTARGDRSIAVGNLIGSSVFNIALILGPTVLVAAGTVPVPEDVLALDLVLMVAAAVVCVPAFLTHRRLGRFEGGGFVVAYVAYMVWLLATRL